MKINRLSLLIFLIISPFINITGYSQTNNIEITPSNLDMGEWPIGAWQEPAKMYLTNSGFNDLEIYSSELQDPNNIFVLNNISIPYILTPFADTAVLNVSIANENIIEGAYSAIYETSCNNGNSISSANILVSAYTPSVGDVFENAIQIDLPYSETNLSTSFPLRSNYQLLENSENGNDIVYKFELTEDVIIDFAISNANSSSIMALYKEDFMGYGGPSFNNSIETTTNNSIEGPLFSGIYYLIVSNQTTNSGFEFDLDISTIPIPVPETAFNPYPSNNAEEIPNYGTVLQWELPEYTKEYRVLFGTTYPPEVILDWTDNLNTSYILPELEINLTYNWIIEVRNSSGTATSNVWEFTTGLSPPLNLSATLIEVTPYQYNVELNWDNPSKALLSYNIFRNGDLIANLIPDIDNYVDENASPNMDSCHKYSIEAIWDEGLVGSDTVFACIPENGNITGTLTNIETGELINGQALLNLASETGGINYTFQSDYSNNSNYSYNVAIDNYTLTITHPDYIIEMVNDVEINLMDTATIDVALRPYPFVVDTVFAEIINDTTAKINWIPDSTFINSIISYEVYRKTCVDNSDWEFLTETTELTFLDEDWNTLDLEEYKYAVKTVYNLLTSDFKESNCNYTEPIVTVNIEVTTNSGDAPGDCQVHFLHLSDSSLNTYCDIDNSGIGTLLQFNSGIYDIYLTCPGYVPLEYSNVNINSDTTFVFLIYESFYNILGLYVTPTGIATWDTAYPEYNQNIDENFDDGFPENWKIINEGNSSDSWEITSNPEFNNSPYIICNSSDVGDNVTFNEYLVSPVLSVHPGYNIFLEWDQNYQNSSPNDFFEIEVFNGYTWKQVYFQNYDDNAWPEPTHHILDISENLNGFFKIRFHYVANSPAWYLALDNIQIYKEYGKSEDAFQFHKVWHDGLFVDDTDTAYYDFKTMDVFDLVPGETYVAGVASLHTTGLSQRTEYTWTYQPSSSFQGPSSMNAYNMEATNDMMIEWQNLDQLEILEINQEYGNPQTAFYQNFESAYGVVYDFSSYPDAMINAIDFRHSSWGLQGEWEYNVHIIDWDTKTSLASLGPFQTTQNDAWEELVDIGEVLSGGASEIAILIEPLGNTEANAYPRVDCDHSENVNGSVFGNLNDLNTMQVSTNGNFLMDVWIQTANGSKKASHKQIPDYYSIGTNIYRNDELLAFVPKPDSSFIDFDLEPGYYDYCVATVYTADSGLHTWTSMVSEVCINDIICNPHCDEPLNLLAQYSTEMGNELFWDSPASQEELLGYNVYSEDELLNEELITDTYFYHSCEDYYERCYVVTAVYEECESDPSNEACSSHLAVNHIEKPIEIFPNPAKDFVIIESFQNILSMKITNSLGQIIYSNKHINQTHYKINTSGFGSGSFFIEIQTDTGIRKEKILISE